jgi:hypothetical protein
MQLSHVPMKLWYATQAGLQHAHGAFPMFWQDLKTWASWRAVRKEFLDQESAQELAPLPLPAAPDTAQVGPNDQNADLLLKKIYELSEETHKNVKHLKGEIATQDIKPEHLKTFTQEYMTKVLADTIDSNGGNYQFNLSLNNASPANLVNAFQAHDHHEMAEAAREMEEDGDGVLVKPTVIAKAGKYTDNKLKTLKKKLKAILFGGSTRVEFTKDGVEYILELITLPSKAHEFKLCKADAGVAGAASQGEEEPVLEAEKAALAAKVLAEVESLSRELKETTVLWGDNVKELAAVKADKAAQDQVVKDLTLEKDKAATDLAAQVTEVERLTEAKETSETKNKATLDELKRTLASKFEERVNEACLSLKRTHSDAFDEALAAAIGHNEPEIQPESESESEPESEPENSGSSSSDSDSE